MAARTTTHQTMANRVLAPLSAALCAFSLLALEPPPARAAEATDDAPPLVLAEPAPAPLSGPHTFTARRVEVAARVPQDYPPAGAPEQQARLAPYPLDQGPLPESPPLVPTPPRSDSFDGSALAVPAQARTQSHPHLGVIIGASGIEQPVHGEVALRFAGDFLSARFGGGLVPGSVGAAMLSAVNVQGGALSSWSAEAGLALHPLRGAFFVGATAGHIALSASAPTRLGTVTIEANSLYLTPRIGWLSVWDSGFTLGFELGAQLPIGSTVTVAGPPKAAANAESLARSIASNPLPTAALKFGLLL